MCDWFGSFAIGVKAIIEAHIHASRTFVALEDEAILKEVVEDDD